LEVIEDRKRRWRPGRPAEPLEGRTVVLVDDGIATGGTARAALLALSRSGAARTLLAVPVAPAGVLDHLPIGQGDFVCLLQPHELVAVGMHYADFTQTTDEEVADLLHKAQAAR
jgi:putative phosphoribosyl transferase